MNKTQMQGYRLNYKRNIVFPKSSILVLGPRKNWAFISSMPKLRFICRWLSCPLEVFVSSIWWKEIHHLVKKHGNSSLIIRRLSRSRNTSLAIFELRAVFLCTYSNILVHFDRQFFFWSLRVDSLSMYIHFFVKFVVEANLYLLLWFHFWNTVSSQSTH